MTGRMIGMRDRSRVGCVIDRNRLERYSKSSEVEAFQWVLKCVYACVYIAVFICFSFCLSLCILMLPSIQFLFHQLYPTSNHPHQIVHRFRYAQVPNFLHKQAWVCTKQKKMLNYCTIITRIIIVIIITTVLTAAPMLSYNLANRRGMHEFC